MSYKNLFGEGCNNRKYAGACDKGQNLSSQRESSPWLQYSNPCCHIQYTPTNQLHKMFLSGAVTYLGRKVIACEEKEIS